ncbi:hypothetical protein MKW94_009902 [Papaver nudicaule]|uniref:Uncharacterized protein n=1 Tax=Papaver nudicaule TaxID=74823 RepID=A0AA42ASV6_PAPNU|nr:hypothetical protein [Papaver nudicaule]
MKDRGKAVAVASSSGGSNWFTTDYSSYSDLPCKKHPSSSSAGGICAYCLKDRLIKLVCSDCGEQRLSSCSCSDMSSSYTSAEVGSVGRISFLIENEKELDSLNNHIPHSTGNINMNKPIRSDLSAVILKRSSSSCVGVKRHGFWRFGRLFRKKGEKHNGVEFREEEGASVVNRGGFDEKNEMWVFHNVDSVPRSRSLCGFRGGFDASETVGGMSDSKRAGNAELAANRKPGIIHGVESILGGSSSAGKNVGVVDSESGSGSSMKNDNTSSENVGLKGFDKNDGVMEMDHDSGFIDLKLGFSSDSKPEFSCLKNSFETESGFRVSKDSNFSGHESDSSFSYLRGERIFSNGSSCRITVNEKEIKKCRKSLRIWKWIFKNHASGTRSACKKHEKHCIRS